MTQAEKSRRDLYGVDIVCMSHTMAHIGHHRPDESHLFVAVVLGQQNNTKTNQCALPLTLGERTAIVANAESAPSASTGRKRMNSDARPADKWTLPNRRRLN